MRLQTLTGLHAFTHLVFTDKICLQEFRVPETRGKVWIKKGLSLVQEEDQVRKHLNQPDTQKSMGPDRGSRKCWESSQCHCEATLNHH